MSGYEDGANIPWAPMPIGMTKANHIRRQKFGSGGLDIVSPGALTLSGNFLGHDMTLKKHAPPARRGV